MAVFFAMAFFFRGRRAVVPIAIRCQAILSLTSNKETNR